ncbi:hypothetical protein LINPERHAP1_LOCUS22860, partial [Linum perenne]
RNSVEQYARVLEYKLELIPGIIIDNGAAYTAYKMYQGQRLDERVVTADRERGKVSCDCNWICLKSTSRIGGHEKQGMHMM